MRTDTYDIEEMNRIAELRCGENGCQGSLDPCVIIMLKSGCDPGAYACRLCGRMHWSTGEPVFNEAGNAVFLARGRFVMRVVEKKQ